MNGVSYGYACSRCSSKAGLDAGIAPAPRRVDGDARAAKIHDPPSLLTDSFAKENIVPHFENPPIRPIHGAHGGRPDQPGAAHGEVPFTIAGPAAGEVELTLAARPPRGGRQAAIPSRSPDEGG